MKNLFNFLDVENLRLRGFINYFGMQRFGTYNVRTHEIGIECLKQNWIKVIHMILSQHPDGDDYQAERKRRMLKFVFEEGNVDEALKLIDKRDVNILRLILIATREDSISIFEKTTGSLLQRLPADCKEHQDYIHPRLPVIRVEQSCL
jgi:tRNA(Glu) U13 pseudouridine synthase TruD